MVYIFGFFGFVMGFAIGLGTINVLLRNKSLSEIQEKKSLKWTYGLIVWLMAVISGWIGFWVHNTYFY